MPRELCTRHGQAWIFALRRRQAVPSSILLEAPLGLNQHPGSDRKEVQTCPEKEERRRAAQPRLQVWKRQGSDKRAQVSHHVHRGRNGARVPLANVNTVSVHREETTRAFLMAASYFFRLTCFGFVLSCFGVPMR